MKYPIRIITNWLDLLQSGVVAIEQEHDFVHLFDYTKDI